MRSTFDLYEVFKTIRFSTARSLYIKFSWFRALVLIGTYSLWNLFCQTIFLSFVTLFPNTSSSKLHEISETYNVNQLNFLAITAAVFTLAIHAWNPLTQNRFQELFPIDLLRTRFFPGFGRGIFLVVTLLGAFFLSNTHRFLGFMIQPDDAVIQIFSIFLRIVSLFCLIYCEEYLFRSRILSMLMSSLPRTWAVLGASFAYCLVKAIQLPMSLMQLATLFLMSLFLCARFIKNEETSDFVWGAGLLAGVLVALQPIFSLPVFGSEFPGLLLVKYVYSQLPDWDQAQRIAEPTSAGVTYVRLLTGGIAGPLAGLAFPLLLLVDFFKQGLHRISRSG